MLCGLALRWRTPDFRLRAKSGRFLSVMSVSSVTFSPYVLGGGQVRGRAGAAEPPGTARRPCSTVYRRRSSAYRRRSSAATAGEPPCVPCSFAYTRLRVLYYESSVTRGVIV